MSRARLAWALAFVSSACSEPLPEIAEVPPFELISQDGLPFGTAQLQGRVWVANFVFTTCPSVCPMLTTQMGNLQRRVDDEVLLVSFSVDPERDTPEVLRRYREAHDADWTFLTGRPDEVRRVITEGLKMGMGERDADGDITHAMHFVLVDREGKIRGFYRTDADSQQALEQAIRDLL